MLLYHPIRSPVDYHHLQIDIDCLCDWTDLIYLQFNNSKCKFMIISRKRKSIQPHQPLAVHGTQLERVYSHKYLGVWLTFTLNWSTQITESSTKARSQLGVLYRNFYQHSNSTTLFQLYISYVRPHLEYAATVWDPHQLQVGLNQSLDLEYSKVCTEKVHKELEPGIRCLTGIPTLADRRKQLKL